MLLVKYRLKGNIKALLHSSHTHIGILKHFENTLRKWFSETLLVKSVQIRFGAVAISFTFFLHTSTLSFVLNYVLVCYSAFLYSHLMQYMQMKLCQ